MERSRASELTPKRGPLAAPRYAKIPTVDPTDHWMMKNPFKLEAWVMVSIPIVVVLIGFIAAVVVGLFHGG